MTNATGKMPLRNNLQHHVRLIAVISVVHFWPDLQFHRPNVSCHLIQQTARIFCVLIFASLQQEKTSVHTFFKVFLKTLEIKYDKAEAKLNEMIFEVNEKFKIMKNI